ncbi:signal recognition particle protein [Slackia heliotrinireducens]|uniref:Signal recognition particle protein n=1 Tax=Slackia heliotrinireducens (strain ATCC 29202 / DSM 20476 / NCTC 11029 / RHS 1) TaxID=471855 RepID=C7N562_SLAHD|nr:signal recognition particle protein [Slackia heliotrinireducens]ACV22047.1 signal recognition particle subunit FFH/SRP54 (srp54) [Slackia heliotrinireducens DSM 20476]VEG99997.1 Fifty-four homolog [Slackia heliotrinireducens]
MFESLSDRLQNIFSGLRGKGRLTEDDINSAMREIRMALLEADVNFKVVKQFTADTKQRCLEAEVLESLTPAQNVVKIVLDELTKLLGENDAKLNTSSRIPNVIMLVGLQGSGKTTAAAKLAYLLKGKGHVPLLVAGDVYRPAAADQLETLGGEIGVKVFRGDGKDPVQIAKDGVRYAIDNLRDVVIVDTAGRLHVDEQMMDEAAAIKEAVKPEEILMVVDAMTGQDVVNVASAFAEKVEFDGVIMSKMDGDARGGGALSLKQVTGKPIKFISAGEKPDSLEEFHPDRMAKRILGMGDVVSLIEQASKIQAEEIEEEQAERLARADINLNDFLEIRRQVNKMGGISKLLSAMPGGDKAMAEGNVDMKALDRMETVIYSMTAHEREHPEVLNASRRQRIAAGCGLTVQDVNQVMKQFNETRKMVKQMMRKQEQAMGNRASRRKGKKGKKGKRGMGRGLMPGGMSMGQMRDLQKMFEDAGM